MVISRVISSKDLDEDDYNRDNYDGNNDYRVNNDNKSNKILIVIGVLISFYGGEENSL